MKKLYLGVLALFLTGLVTVVLAAAPDQRDAAPPGPPCFQGHMGHHPALGAYLNLSKEQKEKMSDLENRHFMETRDLRYDLARKRLEMGHLFTDPKTGDEALLAKQRELNALRERLFDKRAQTEIQWRKILTPEQIRKLDRVPMHFGMGGGMYPPDRWSHKGPGGAVPGMTD